MLAYRLEFVRVVLALVLFLALEALGETRISVVPSDQTMTVAFLMTEIALRAVGVETVLATPGRRVPLTGKPMAPSRG